MLDAERDDSLMSDLLPILYQQIADLTAPSCQNGTAECAQHKDKKYRCCERQYCELARKFAKEKYGIDLQETGNPDLPFMGENGCTVAPHLRPICALHCCTMTDAAKSHINHDPAQTKLYLDLAAEIQRNL